MIKLNFDFLPRTLKISALGKEMIFKDEIQNELVRTIFFEYFIEQKLTSRFDFAKLAI